MARAVIARQGGLSGEAFYSMPSPLPASPDAKDSAALGPADVVAGRLAAGHSQPAGPSPDSGARRDHAVWRTGPGSRSDDAAGPDTSASSRSATLTGRSMHASGIGSAGGGVPSTRSAAASSGRAGTGAHGWSGPSDCLSFAGTPPACRKRKREPSLRAGCGKSARPVRRAGRGNGARTGY